MGGGLVLVRDFLMRLKMLRDDLDLRSVGVEVVCGGARRWEDIDVWREWSRLDADAG